MVLSRYYSWPSRKARRSCANFWKSTVYKIFMITGLPIGHPSRLFQARLWWIRLIRNWLALKLVINYNCAVGLIKNDHQDKINDHQNKINDHQNKITPRSRQLLRRWLLHRWSLDLCLELVSCLPFWIWLNYLLYILCNWKALLMGTTTFGCRCNKLDKKDYYPIFKLTGFTGFDGSFKNWRKNLPTFESETVEVWYLAP